MDTAFQYLGVQEIGSNDGPEVSKFLASTGLNPGYAWCAAFMTFCIRANPDIVLPTVRSARAQSFITRGSVKASDVLRGITRPEIGWLVVWKNGNGPFGHIGAIIFWRGECGVTIEGNTSSGILGNQRDGDGVWLRYRCIEPGNRFRIVSFTPVTYE
jgi:hypothetical protein